MVREITKCRVCENRDLVPVVDLGEQFLTGIFPKSKDQKVTRGPLRLVRCHDDGTGQYCGLLQLRHSFNLDEMYGDNYGYRSGLNQSMVNHLHGKVRSIREFVDLRAGDLVMDIGSNDATTLKAYPEELTLVGVDPTGKKFRSFYPAHVQLIPDFFPCAALTGFLNGRRCKVITSIAMFYDLEDPLSFMRAIYDHLADDGIWVFEQSYMPSMMERDAYDTICHEHLEYYGLRQIQWMVQKTGLKILDVEFNDTNGGSFSVTVSRQHSTLTPRGNILEEALNREHQRLMHTDDPYLAFAKRIAIHREQLIAALGDLRAAGKKVLGYGASTKGNVILQYCNLTTREIPCIADVNPDKFGALTPGTGIPIVSEKEAKALKPDYFLVLPWHFRDHIIAREKEFISAGGKLIFPLPSIQIVP